MNQSPSFQFYPSDYLADEKVQVMTIEDEGCYIRLMAYCWREGSIPADPEMQARLCKGTVPSRVVQVTFMNSVDDPNRLVHPRLELERQKQAQWRAKCAVGGRHSSGKPKRTNEIDIEQGTTKGSLRVVEVNANSSSSSSSKEKHIQTHTADNNTAELFDTFWKAYPKRLAKGDALKAFKALRPTRELLDKMLTAIERQRTHPDWQKQGGQFIPYPATWLRARRWEDEPVAPLIEAMLKGKS
jgi:uncharacterized protein YdaU (DUF1376 family)